MSNKMRDLYIVIGIIFVAIVCVFGAKTTLSLLFLHQAMDSVLTIEKIEKILCIFIFIECIVCFLILCEFLYILWKEKKERK